MSKPTYAQKKKLATVPDDWRSMPLAGDMRSYGPLERAGLIETRTIDKTPADFMRGIRVVDRQYRRTDAGRAVLSPPPQEGEVGSPNVTNHGSKSDLHPEYVTSEAGTKSGYKSDLHPGNVPAEDDA